MGAWTYGSSVGAEGDVATVRAIYEAFERRDLDAALTHLAADVEFQLPATGGLAGREGPYRGHAGVREYFADAERVWSELVLHAEDIRAASGGVIVFGHVRGRIGGDVVRREVVWSWKLRDGLATSVRASDLGRPS